MWIQVHAHRWVHFARGIREINKATVNQTRSVSNAHRRNATGNRKGAAWCKLRHATAVSSDSATEEARTRGEIQNARSDGKGFEGWPTNDLRYRSVPHFG